MADGEGVFRTAQGQVDEAAQLLGPDRDIPFPGVYTTPEVMTWMRDEYETLAGGARPAAVTGKPATLDGSAAGEEATARVAEAVRQRGRV